MPVRGSGGTVRPPVVTALTVRGRGSVAVTLDGVEWRVLPTAVVVSAGLAVGGIVDRPTARRVGQLRRRHRAEAAALRALGARDHTSASLEQRLTDRRIAPGLVRETVARARRAGLVDDDRFAIGRATLLAERGAGDMLIAADLEHQGVPDEVACRALDVIDAESERAGRIVVRRGMSPQTLRYLAAKGFSEETLEPLVADMTLDGVG